jgi:hypothetical protein
MGLSFELEATQAPPVRGEKTVNELINLIDLAKLADPHLQDALYDCINNRYRTPSFRDYIKDLVAKGMMSEQQKLQMQTLLVGIRHKPRTPGAKAWRYQWP